LTLNIQNAFLTPNEWSRPQRKIGKIKGIVIHWVANPMTSAMANRNYFEGRKNNESGSKDYGSAHYIVGLEGEILLCMPETEVAYHVGSPIYTKEALTRLFSDPINDSPSNYTIGIECCHLDWDGKMNDKTYNIALELAVDLLYRYGLTENDLWLHKEVVGWKDCHRWFVNNPAEWIKFKALAGQKLKERRAPKEELSVLEKWQLDLGVAAVKYLCDAKLLNKPETWMNEKELAKPVPSWLFFEMLKRMRESK
jgi:N-acetylmuramoyl-L-alanine amidase CwlA